MPGLSSSLMLEYLTQGGIKKQHEAVCYQAQPNRFFCQQRISDELIFPLWPAPISVLLSHLPGAASAPAAPHQDRPPLSLYPLWLESVFPAFRKINIISLLKVFPKLRKKTFNKNRMS